MPTARTPCIDCGSLIRKPSLRCRPCNNKFQMGENNPSWKGGISKNNMMYKRIQKDRYPERARARSMVYSAIRAGRLARQACQWPRCNVGPDSTQSHHWSYEPGRELDVTSFCKDHHRLVDRMTREQFEFIRAAAIKKAIRHIQSNSGPLAMRKQQQHTVLACKER